jgi:hypothetical protein
MNFESQRQAVHQIEHHVASPSVANDVYTFRNQLPTTDVESVAIGRGGNTLMAAGTLPPLEISVGCNAAGAANGIIIGHMTGTVATRAYDRFGPGHIAAIGANKEAREAVVADFLRPGDGLLNIGNHAGSFMRHTMLMPEPVMHGADAAGRNFSSRPYTVMRQDCNGYGQFQPYYPMQQYYGPTPPPYCGPMYQQQPYPTQQQTAW